MVPSPSSLELASGKVKKVQLTVKVEFTGSFGYIYERNQQSFVCMVKFLKARFQRHILTSDANVSSGERVPEVRTTLRAFWLTSQNATAGFKHQRQRVVDQAGGGSPSSSSFLILSQFKNLCSNSALDLPNDEFQPVLLHLCSPMIFSTSLNHCYGAACLYLYYSRLAL